MDYLLIDDIERRCKDLGIDLYKDMIKYNINFHHVCEISTKYFKGILKIINATRMMGQLDKINDKVYILCLNLLFYHPSPI